MRTLRHRCRALADFTDDELRAEIGRRWAGAHVPGAAPAECVEVSGRELHELINGTVAAIAALQEIARLHEETASRLRRQLGLLEYPDAMFLLAAEIAANRFEFDEAVYRTIGDR